MRPDALTRANGRPDSRITGSSTSLESVDVQVHAHEARHLSVDPHGRRDRHGVVVGAEVVDVRAGEVPRARARGEAPPLEGRVVAELLGGGVAHGLEPAELGSGPAPNVFEPPSHHARCQWASASTRGGDEAAAGDEASPARASRRSRRGHDEPGPAVGSACP